MTGDRSRNPPSRSDDRGGHDDHGPRSGDERQRSRSDGSLSRRTALGLLGVGTAASLAGCSGLFGDAGERPNGTDTVPIDREWDGNVDAGGHSLVNLGSLSVDHLHARGRDPDVVVWKDADGTFHADSREGPVYTGGDDEDVLDAIQAAVDSLTEGRDANERVLVASPGEVGPADELRQVVLPSYTTLDVPATIRVRDRGEALVNPIRALEAESIEIPRLSIEGNPRLGVILQNCRRVRIGDVRIRFADVDRIASYTDYPGGWPPPAHDHDSTREEVLADPVHVGEVAEGIRISGRSREGQTEDIQVRSVYVEGGRHHAVETYSAERVQIGQVIARDQGGCGVILNDTREATVNSVVGYNPDSPTRYATFRCANHNENVSVGQVVSRDAPRGVHITTDSDEITIGEVNVVGARNRGISIDEVENVTIQGGLVKNVDEEAVVSWGDAIAIQNLRIVDDRPEAERRQTHAIAFSGENGRIVNNDVRNGGTVELIDVDSESTVVSGNLGDGVDSGTVTLETGESPAARVDGVSESVRSALDLRAQPAAGADPPGAFAWDHRFEWTGDAWDLVVEWETDPGEDLDHEYIVDRPQAVLGEPLGELEPIESGTYRIEASHSDLVLEVADGSEQAGADVQQHEWESADHQRWEVERIDADENRYRIAAAHSGHVLEVEDGSTSGAANIQVGEDAEEPHQRWIITPQSPTHYSIENVHSGLAADVFEIGEDPGTTLIQWEYTGGSHQQFRFEEV